MRLLMMLFLFLGIALAQTGQVYPLRNGMTLVVVPNPHAPVVWSSIWYRVGGLDEPMGQTGISHLLEHMMFKGTKRFGPGVFSARINAQGGMHNAMTTADYTMYYELLPADQLALGFKLEADRMVHLQWDPVVFKKEHQVVLEERRLRVDDRPLALMAERFDALALINTPNQHPVVGWMADVRALTMAQVRQWYQQWYAPNNAVLLVMGDVVPAQVLRLAKQYFEPIPARDLPQRVMSHPVPALGRRAGVFAIKSPVPSVAVAYHVPAQRGVAARWRADALALMAVILDSGQGGRLKALVNTQKIAVSVSASYDPDGRVGGLFAVHAVPTKVTDQDAVISAVLKQLARFKTERVSVRTLERAKAQLMAGWVYQQADAASFMMALGRMAMGGYGVREWDARQARIAHLTPARLQQAAQALFVDEELTVGKLAA